MLSFILGGEGEVAMLDGPGPGRSATRSAAGDLGCLSTGFCEEKE